MSEDDKECCGNCTYWYGFVHDFYVAKHLPDDSLLRHYGFCIRCFEYVSDVLNDEGTDGCSDYEKEEW